MSNLHERTVTRVLVMLEYGEGDPDNGEVYDLTALVSEVKEKTGHYRGNIVLEVTCADDYIYSALRPAGTPMPTKLEVSWRCGYSASAGNLTDALNTGLPDGERVEGLKKRASRLHKKAADLEYDAKVAKLEQVAAVRLQHPIARVTAALPEIPPV